MLDCQILDTMTGTAEMGHKEGGHRQGCDLYFLIDLEYLMCLILRTPLWHCADMMNEDDYAHAISYYVLYCTRESGVFFK